MMKKLIAVLGPTAVGKTKFAARLAYEFEGEILSADSRQIYKFMDIGTGKDLDDYIVSGGSVPYHLIDVVEPTEEFDVYQFKKLFITCCEEISSRKKIPFLVGGSGLYLSSIIQNYNLVKVDFESERAEELKKLDETQVKIILQKFDSKLHNTTDLTDKQRMIKSILINENRIEADEPQLYEFLIIGLAKERSEIKSGITARLKQRLNNGMIEEVNDLISMGVPVEKLKFFGLEYKYITQYLIGEINYNDMFQKLNSAIHDFAKRQMTWFRKMEKEGVDINWMSPTEYDKAAGLLRTFLNG